ncbi:DUF1254 domain-containing protein [Pseudomonas sp. IT-196MI5]|uniref:DUF1254 domain-containing protein n=1 Tax=unclassified Pseudomonas TaxID=196821 RepID=UPI0039DFD352
MKTARILHFAATAFLGVLVFSAVYTSTHAEEQTPDTLNTRIGKLKYEVGYPSKETSQKLYDEMDFQRATQAYLWSFPAVSFASVKAGLFHDLGATYNDIVLWENFLDSKALVLTGNNSTIYAVSQMDLKDGPVVVEVPAGPTAGAFADLWFETSGVGHLGPDKGNGGKYLLVPPGYQGELPKDGYFVVPFKTMDANFFIRGIVIKGDVAGAADMIAKSRVYPYSERANPKPGKVLRVTGKYANTIEPQGLAYWKLLSEVIEHNPVAERDRFFMAMLKPLGIEKGKPFAPDDRQKRILEEGARLGHAMAQNIAFDSRFAASPVYPGKHWMNVFVMNTQGPTQQESEYYSQLDERLNYLYLGTWPIHAMNLPVPSQGQRYIEAFKDKDGNPLDGSKHYKLHVPANPPVENFWSVTVYDTLTRSMTMNKANKPAIRSSADKITQNADGSWDLYFGPKAPAGQESNWVDTSASKGWWVWFRFYSPTKPFFDQSWQLPDFERVK